MVLRLTIIPITPALPRILKQAGVPLLVLENQTHAIPLMKSWTKPQDHYLEITTHDNVIIPFHESRAFLARLGIPGEILPTPGHSNDSVSLLLDDGAVFTRDLTHPALIAEDEAGAIARKSWQLLRERGGTRVYPGHGPVRQIP